MATTAPTTLEVHTAPGRRVPLLADAPLDDPALDRFGFADFADPEEIGRRYLAKIVQLEIALPPPVPADMRRVIREYGPSLRRPQPVPGRRPTRSLRDRMAQLRRRVRASESRLMGLWRAAERVALRLRWWPLPMWFVVAGVYVEINPAAADETAPTTFLDVVVLLILPLLAFAVALWSRRLRKRQRRLREDLRGQIDELKGRQLTPEEIEREVAQRAPEVPEGGRALISDLVHSSFLDSEEFRAVETFIAENPPALPRQAKRSFNHAQLLTEIARARHMFGGDPVLTPAHLAKWLVLREQWPALGRSIALEPERLAKLESAAEPEEISPEAFELLCSAPRLGKVIERLVYFQPANNGVSPQ